MTIDSLPNKQELHLNNIPLDLKLLRYNDVCYVNEE